MSLKFGRKALDGWILSGTLLALLLIPMTALTPTAQAETLDVQRGDLYMISTIRGEAWTKINGEVVNVSLTVELTCEVTEVYGDIVLFRLKGGYITLNQTTYEVSSANWRGIYNRQSERAIVEGYASNSEGGRLYFIFHAKDIAHTQGGTFMKAVGGLRDPGAIHWLAKLILWRYRLG